MKIAIRQIVIIFCLSLSLTNCQSFQKRKELAGMKGMSSYFIEKKWGSPEKVKKLSKHRTQKEFHDITTTRTNPLNDEITATTCDISITFEKGIVVLWKYYNCKKQRN